MPFAAIRTHWNYIGKYKVRHFQVKARNVDQIPIVIIVYTQMYEDVRSILKLSIEFLIVPPRRKK